MQQIRGKAQNTTCYIYDGYQYHIDTTHVQIYRCSTRSSTRCRGAARVDGQGNVDVYRAHEGHEANPTLYDELQMKNEMLDLAASSNTSLKDIFDNVCRGNLTVAPKLVYTRLKSSMERARSRSRPVIPSTLRELATALDSYAPMQAVYRGLVEAEDNSIALIFASDQLIDELGHSEEMYIDGTFKVTPNHPPIAQLFSIHIRVEDTGIAAVFVLCSARTRSLYDAIFLKMKTLAPGLVANLRFVMGDYERAAMRALRNAFPAANLHGCWFHFNQAIWRYWRHLGLSNAPKTIVTFAMALPLAPVNHFEEGLGILGNIADEIGGTYPRVLEFMRYLRRQWLPLAEVVCVYGRPLRTNNIVESFHNQAKRKLGGLHPNIWKFLELLTNMIIDQGIDLDRVKNHQRVRRPRTIKNMLKDTIIRDAQHALSVDRYTLRQFLERCASRTPAFHASIVPEEAFIDETDQLVEPGLLTLEDPEVAEPVRRRGRRRNAAADRVAPPAVVEAPQAAPVVEPMISASTPPDAQNEHGNAESGAAGAEVIAHIRRRSRRLAGGNIRSADLGSMPVLPDIVESREEEIRAQNEPADASPRALGIERLESVDSAREEYGNDEDFRLPEDDWEVYQEPEEPIPYHPIDPLEIGAAAERDPGTCCVCLVTTATHVFFTCGHLCCCGDCTNAIGIGGRCPICRREITATVRVISSV